MSYQSLSKNFDENTKSISYNETKLNNLIAESASDGSTSSVAHSEIQLKRIIWGGENAKRQVYGVHPQQMQGGSPIILRIREMLNIAKQQPVWVGRTRSKL